MREGDNHTHGSIPAVCPCIFTFALESLGIGWLKVFSSRWLDVDQVTITLTYA